MSYKNAGRKYDEELYVVSKCAALLEDGKQLTLREVEESIKCCKILYQFHIFDRQTYNYYFNMFYKLY